MPTVAADIGLPIYNSLASGIGKMLQRAGHSRE
jgi:hypothetical protein